MKIVKKLAAFLILIAGIFAMASCGNKSGVTASMSYTATTSKIKITATFAENANLKSGDATPSIKEFAVDDSGNSTFKETKNLTFSSGAYTTSSAEFTGLTKNTTYIYKLYVKYKSYDELITELEAKTSAEGDSDDTAIEISTVEQFNAIGDDPSAHYILKEDLDFENKNVTTSLSASTDSRFKGVFDGNGHTIKNFTLPSAANIGLFAYTDGATIKNLNIDTVVGDFSSGRSDANIGALIGKAEKTTVNNVKVNNVNITVQGNSSATISVGGVIGYGIGCSFDTVSSTAVSVIFTQSRLKVNAGLFGGVLEDKGAQQKEINGESVYYLADKCSASGSITASLYYSSSEGYTHIGGFAGDISSLSVVNDSYADSNIFVTKAKLSSVNKFYLAVGGFVGCNNTSANKIKIYKSLANTNIQVYSTEAAPISTNGNYDIIDAYDSSKDLTEYKNYVNEALIKEYNTFKSEDYDQDDYTTITTLKNNASEAILKSETTGEAAYQKYNDTVVQMNDVLKRCYKNNITTSSSSKLYTASVGGFMGEALSNVVLSNCIIKEKIVNEIIGLEVCAKDTQSITKDDKTEDKQVLFVDGCVAKNSGNTTGITNYKVWTEGMDISSYGENVKAFLEK